MPSFKCSGWWEQQGYGRQPMNELQLSFDNGLISGVGVDIVGKFELHGALKDGGIYLHKQYIGEHAIEYRGVGVGEGAYAGRWSCYGLIGGEWFIAIDRFTDSVSASALEVQELTPAPLVGVEQQ